MKGFSRSGAFDENRRRGKAGTVRERQPFEVHVIALDAFTLDGVRRLQDLGVTDAIVGFRNAYEKDTQTLSQKTEALRRFADAVIRKL